jgi:hypothetical protein
MDTVLGVLAVLGLVYAGAVLASPKFALRSSRAVSSFLARFWRPLREMKDSHEEFISRDKKMDEVFARVRELQGDESRREEYEGAVRDWQELLDDQLVNTSGYLERFDKVFRTLAVVLAITTVTGIVLWLVERSG